MKTMKNLYLPLLIVLFICGAPSAARAQMAGAPDFQSTSVMMSGSSLPQAAVGGPSLAEEPMMDVSGPRRAFGFEDGEDENLSGSETGGMQNPDGPVGAVPMLLMALLAGAYAVKRVRRQAAE